MTEKELSLLFCAKFDEYFYIEKEVMPINSRKRIDLILTSKRSKDYVFGVELKSDAHKQGNGLGKWVRQAEGYSNMNFNIRGYERAIPVLIYPAISSLFIQILTGYEPIIKDTPTKSLEFYPAFHNKYHEHHNLNGIISEFNIGEIRKIQYRNTQEYAFLFKNKILWSENGGHHKSNYNYYFHYSKKN
jgi:hypothetical protein